MMRLVDTSDGNRNFIPLPKQHVEINPSHPIIVGIHALKDREPTLARALAEQVYDNCLISAGLLDDSRSMLPRLNDLLICVVNGAKEGEEEKAGTQNEAQEEGTKDEAQEGTEDSDTTQTTPQMAVEDPKPEEEAEVKVSEDSSTNIKEKV